MRRNLAVTVLLLVLLAVAVVGKKAKEVDPKECEVCINNLEQIDMLIPKESKRDHDAIEKAINTHCTLSGAGSEWKPTQLSQARRM